MKSPNVRTPGIPPVSFPNLPMIDHLKHNPNPQGRHCLTQNENNVEN